MSNGCILVCGLAFTLVGCDRVFDVQGGGPDVDATIPADVDADSDAVSTRDTDGDGVLDSVDNCPGIASSQTDTDTDGVGDACDPHPGEMDTLVSVTLFHATSDAWNPSPTTGWSRTDGSITSPLGGTLVYDTTQTLYRPSLQVGFSFLDFGDQTNAHNNQIELLLVDGDNADCEARDDNAGDNHSDLLLHVRGTSTPQTKPLVPPLALDTRYILTYSRGTTSRCALGIDAVQAGDAVDSYAVQPAIRLDYLQVKIDYIALYQGAK